MMYIATYCLYNTKGIQETSVGKLQERSKYNSDLTQD
jgi:hypothetical protein